MKLIPLLCAFVISSLANAATVVSTADEFKQATENWDSLDEGQRLRNWEHFESKYQDIYDDVVYQKQTAGWEERQIKKRQKFFQSLPGIRTDMLELFQNTNISEAELRFKELFSDLPGDIPVVLMPSIFSFNGKVTYVSQFKQSALLIGIDFVAQRKDNIHVLFSHEFFHAYHQRKIPEGSTGATMATPLWKEGFATYVSGALNPEQTDEVLLMDKDLAAKCNQSEFVAEIANQYLAVLETDGEATYADWFLMSGPTQPTRRGYCLGLHVVREIAKTNSILDMTTWEEARFSKVIKGTLVQISRKNL